MIRLLFKLMIILFFPILVYPMGIGPQLGAGYESWDKSASPYYEKSSYIIEPGIITNTALTKRIHLFMQGGASFSSDTATGVTQYNNFYLGTLLGWIIHPDYSPFIGAGIYYKRYSEVIDTMNKNVFILNFAGGTKVMKFNSSALWLMLDIGLFNSQYKNYYLSYFKLSVSYLFDF